MANRSEVARLAGVSEATVSRVLNGIGPMKESTRQRVLEAAKTLNYELNAVAANFARGQSGNLGVVLPHVPKVHLISTYYFSELISGIGEAVRARGYGLLLLFRDPETPYDYVSLFRTRRVDACVVLGANSREAEVEAIGRLAAERLPFCVMDQRFDNPHVSVIAADHVQGSRAAVEHLIGRGHRAIGYLNGSPQFSNSLDRLEGYRQALEEAGIAFDPSLVYEGNYSRTSGRQAAERVYADLRAGRLDAIFVANDRMAVGLAMRLRELGVRMPEELKLAAYDDSDAASLSELTTVRVPFYDMGHLAADRLLGGLTGDGEHEAFHEKLQTELKIRKSSG